MVMKKPSIQQEEKENQIVEQQWTPAPSKFKRVAAELNIPPRTLYSAYRMFGKFKDAVDESSGYMILDRNHPAFLDWLKTEYTPFQKEKPSCLICGKQLKRARAKFCSEQHLYQWNRENGFYSEIGRIKSKHKKGEGEGTQLKPDEADNQDQLDA